MSTTTKHLTTTKMGEKEKAKELILSFYRFAKGQTNEARLINAKQCALICVKNEQKALDKMALYWDLKNGEWYKDECISLEKIKLEIENFEQ